MVGAAYQNAMVVRDTRVVYSQAVWCMQWRSVYTTTPPPPGCTHAYSGAWYTQHTPPDYICMHAHTCSVYTCTEMVTIDTTSAFSDWSTQRKTKIGNSKLRHPFMFRVGGAYATPHVTNSCHGRTFARIRTGGFWTMPRWNTRANY
jgi:hypothetical protein